MQMTMEYDGPQWRRLKAIRRAMYLMGPRGQALADALHCVMGDDLAQADALISAAMQPSIEHLAVAMSEVMTTDWDDAAPAPDQYPVYEDGLPYQRL